MTAYKNFVSDFPARCLDVLEKVERAGALRDRDVTLTLMAACAGFVVPFERLDIKKSHPTNDATRFREAAEQLEGLLKENFLASSLGEGATSWRTGELQSIVGDPESWTGLQKAKSVTKDKTVGGLLRVMRNALAHGNIFTFDNPIQAILLVSANKDDKGNIKSFNFIEASPADFRRFLIAWFSFLSNAKIPPEAVEQELARAA